MVPPLPGRGALTCALLLLCAGWAPSAQQPQHHSEEPGPDAATTADPFERPPPSDPDDAPFMDAPRNQLGQWSTARRRGLTRGFDDDHWLQLSAVPSYAALRVPFIGRGQGPFRGGGAALELDLRVFRWLFVRAFASHTVHPVFAESSYDEDSGASVELAEGGLMQVTNTGASLVYAFDIGRFVPRLDVGAGLLFVRSPSGPLDGQWGGECREGNICDLGLSCSIDNRCQATPVLEGHAGIALDVLFGQHWAVGIGVRYYALFSALSQLPVYLTGSVRLAARF